MIKLFFYWLFQRSKTLQGLVKIHSDQNVVPIKLQPTRDSVIVNLFSALQVNQNKFLRRKWDRITTNKNSPFYIYRSK